MVARFWDRTWLMSTDQALNLKVGRATVNALVLISHPRTTLVSSGRPSARYLERDSGEERGTGSCG